MSKLSITEAVKIISVSESTLRRDLKSGKVSFDLDLKGRKQIDVSELQRVYDQLKTQNGSQPPTDDSVEHSEPVNGNHQNLSLTENDSHQNPSTNGSEPRQNPSMTQNDTCQNLSMNGNDSPKIIELLEGQVQDLKERLEKADTEKSRLLELANNLQKQNELLMLPNPQKKPGFWGYLRLKR